MRGHYAYLLLVPLLVVGCAPKATFIQGGEKATAHIEITATGGRIDLQGPFVYCADTTGGKKAGETLLNCPVVELAK